MEKNHYNIGFMGPSTIGKSRLISACIASEELANYIHHGNKIGKTKTNIIYRINAHQGNSYSLKEKDFLSTFLKKKEIDGEIKYIFNFIEFQNHFKSIAATIGFDGIYSFNQEMDKISDLKEWVSRFQIEVKKDIISNLEESVGKTNTDILIDICNKFESDLSYNDLFDLYIELDGSDKIKKVLAKYNLDYLILIDTRGVFDNTDKLKRTFTEDYIPDINILMFNEKGMTDHLFEQVFKEIGPMFGKSFEICIRTATHVGAKSATVENCINPSQHKSFSSKFQTILEQLNSKNVLEGETPFNIRLRENIGTILPEIPIREDNELTVEEDKNNNDKYDDIIFMLFNKVLDLKSKEEESIKYIIEQSKNPDYKKTLIDSVVLGRDLNLFKKYGERCYNAVLGAGGHLTPKPQSGKITSHIENLFFYSNSSDWIENEYICNIVTYEAANLIEDAITEVRENRNNLSDINLSEYLFILKNVFYDTLGLLSKWDAYNFWSSGVTKKRIPRIYYENACKETIKFSEQGTIYYTYFKNKQFDLEHASALLNCIIESVKDLIKDKLNMNNVITEIETDKVRLGS
ncbi:hypothetical protein NST33_25000 [Paenibacillus sp. FSL L8-0435]|uniref:hypothetical protein n=1 Tax=Paenibacillus TaxID=44249 RepID=UPI001C8EE9E4|nr:hypothetical protein [Paenibacillus xylanexedens]MBY0116508.1 hypothetical protein [Paenibacillus xylanexedens]